MMVWLVGKCGCHDRSFSGILGPRLFLSPDNTGYEELNQAMLEEPWSPFSSERDFNWASWFGQSKVAKTEIDDYFGKGLGGMKRGSFRSAYPFEKQIETLEAIERIFVMY